MSNAGRPHGSYTHIHPCRIDGKMTRAYSKYIGMLARCFNPRSHNFKDYGGRGIAVCERWRGKQGYDNFITDMGVPPNGLTLGRLDNAKDYGPDNCAWQTWAEQARSRRPRPQTPGSLRQRARAAGLPYMVVYLRIHNGWTEERALSTPKQPRGRPVGWRKHVT